MSLLIRVKRGTCLLPDTQSFAIPSITDEDIAWAIGVLDLPAAAFKGQDGRDPRLDVLQSITTLDVEACPGSGKTTLLVAKLAVLARKWTDPRRGVCVLSHTNVARREIEQRIGSTTAAQRLLMYPHFIGTIHSFVNEFLALPWLRSKSIPIRAIDNEICQKKRWAKLSYATRVGLQKNNYDHEVLEIADPTFGVGELRWGSGKLGTGTDTYKALRDACKAVTEQGYFCYDEMFVWANDLLDNVPEVCDIIRERFPLLFIDEVQDNSEMQSALVHRLFRAGSSSVIRQRFGDSNQAIFQHSNQTVGATTDPFPNSAVRRDIPNSHRFAQEIADFANPFAVKPQNIVGLGPPTGEVASSTSGRHTIFLFDDATMLRVLPAYAEYLVQIFSESELQRGIFTAIGAVHRPNGDSNPPRHVGHYWSDYDSELTLLEPKPKTFFQYVMAGQKVAAHCGETHPAVEKLAEGIIQLVRLCHPNVDLGNRKRKHRYVRELLADKPDVMASYLNLVSCFVIDRAIPSSDDWKNNWRGKVLSIASALSGTAITAEQAVEFLAWPSPTANGPQRAAMQRDNLFKYPEANPQVQIRVGSIHSVKGETHTATLVLETYFHEHQLAALKSWILGNVSGGDGQGVRMLSRLKQHYVAMTRPTHLLCLAIRSDALTDGQIADLSVKGWKIARLRVDGMDWL